jgi:hypothetical protein
MSKSFENYETGATYLLERFREHFALERIEGK